MQRPCQKIRTRQVESGTSTANGVERPEILICARLLLPELSGISL